MYIVFIVGIILMYSIAKMGTKSEGRLIKTSTGTYFINGEALKELELAEINDTNINYDCFVAKKERTKSNDN